MLESVADKTGFPIDMLELDMQLDVDLGIDSIKRVEILSAVQERLPAAARSAPSRSARCEHCGRLPSFLAGSPRTRAPRFRRSSAFDSSESQRRSSRLPGPNEPGQNGSSAPNGTALAADSKHANGVEAIGTVTLRTLYPRARPLDLPDRRDEVAPRGGGTVWITDDGSPLAQAVERRLAERGYKATVVDSRGRASSVGR